MKKIVDALTVVLLAAAFVLAYYTGFVSRTATGEPVLATGTLALISILGVAVLFGVGGAATAYDRIKRGMVTKSFLALFIVQIFAVVGMIAVMLSILLEMFTIDNTAVRMLYIVFAMISVIGYIDAMLYSDSMAIYDGDEPDDEADDDDDEFDDGDEDLGDDDGEESDENSSDDAYEEDDCE